MAGIKIPNSKRQQKENLKTQDSLFFLGDFMGFIEFCSEMCLSAIMFTYIKTNYPILILIYMFLIHI